MLATLSSLFWKIVFPRPSAKLRCDLASPYVAMAVFGKNKKHYHRWWSLKARGTSDGVEK